MVGQPDERFASFGWLVSAKRREARCHAGAALTSTVRPRGAFAQPAFRGTAIATRAWCALRPIRHSPCFSETGSE
jgi:hypothetical protein